MCELESWRGMEGVMIINYDVHAENSNAVNMHPTDYGMLAQCEVN